MVSYADTRLPQAGIWGFYPLDKQQLLKTIERCFLDRRFGPGRLPERGSRREYQPVAGVAPHAGYEYSGPCAAHLYLELAENMPSLDTVVVIGTNHTGYGGTFTTTLRFRRWATPLGTVEVDTEFIEALMEEARGLLVDNPLAHIEEHSVEVQLPFLQYIYHDEFKLVPIVAKEPTPLDAKTMAEAIHRVAKSLGRKTIVIASSDFTHHGPMYDYVVFSENIAENVAKLDEQLIDKIVAMDTAGFEKLLRETGATVCGPGAITTTIEYAKKAGAKHGVKLRYYNSAMISGDESAVVGYAAIIFPKA